MQVNEVEVSGIRGSDNTVLVVSVFSTLCSLIYIFPEPHLPCFVLIACDDMFSVHSFHSCCLCSVSCSGALHLC